MSGRALKDTNVGIVASTDSPDVANSRVASCFIAYVVWWKWQLDISSRLFRQSMPQNKVHHALAFEFADGAVVTRD